LAPQGSETSTGGWTGSYWTIAATTDIDDQFAAITFSNATVTSANMIGSYTVDPTATIAITITPQQPYWTRSLNVVAEPVYPEVETYSQSKIDGSASWNTGTTVSAMSASVWTWGQSYWTAHTPFTITVTKNGAQWASKTIDTQGIPQTISMVNPSNSKEWVTLKNLGVLSAGYGQPNLPEIALLSPSAILTDPTDVINDVNYNSGSAWTYANYWFGGGSHFVQTGSTAVNAVNGGIEEKATSGSVGSPGFYFRTSGVYGPVVSNYPISDRMFPGDYRSDDTLNYNVKPETPNGEFAGDKTINGKSYYDLYNYLANIGNNGAPFGIESSNAMNVYGSGWSVTNTQNVGSDGYAGYVKEMMPYGSMSSLITLQISTDLANAVVEQLPVSNGVITSMNWLGQSAGASANIGDTNTLYVNVQQDSTVTSTISLFATATAGDNIFLNPSAQTLSLAPGASQQVAIQVLNNGAPSNQAGQVTVTLQNALGATTSTQSIGYTLLTKGVGSTQLTVYTENAQNKQLISGIPVTVGWGTNSQLETSGSQGQGAFTLDLQGYTGTVNLVSSATSKYQSASESVSIAAGINTATLLVEPVGAKASSFNWTLVAIIAAIVAVVAVIGGAAYYTSKKPHAHRRQKN
jgi:hypothetical protein